MPGNRKLNRASVLGSDCILFIPTWKGYAASASQEYITTTGTITEVDTPNGAGLLCGAAASYVRINLTTLIPLTTSVRSMFIRFYTPASSGTFVLGCWGADVLRDYTFLAYRGSADLLSVYPSGGLQGDSDEGADVGGTQTWLDAAVTNVGLVDNPNIVYGNGSSITTGINVGNATTTTSDLYLFRQSAGGPSQCPIGTIIQEVALFKRILTAAEVLTLHNYCVANRL